MAALIPVAGRSGLVIPPDDTRFVKVTCEGLQILVRDPSGDYCPEVDVDGMSVQLWDGGRVMAHMIADKSIDVHEKTVLDIGAGTGACSITAARHGAAHVTASDYIEVARALMRANFTLNGICAEKYTVAGIDWNDVTSVTTQYDVVVGADLVYVTAVAQKLFAVVEKAVVVGGRFYMVHEVRRSVIAATGELEADDEPLQAFLGLLGNAGWSPTVTPLPHAVKEMVLVTGAPP